MLEMHDRLRTHLDAAAPPIDVDLLTARLAAREGMEAMPVATLEPTRESRPPRTRRLRFAAAFAAAAVVTLAAIGAVSWLGGDEVGPSDTTAAPVTTPVTTTVATTPPPSTAPPPTTASTTVAPPPLEAAVVSLDPAVDLAWAQPSIALGSDGRIRVLYQRDDSTVGLAICEGPECTELSVADAYVPGGRLGWVVGTPRTDAGPVFWLGAGGDGAFSTLVVCRDDSCADVRTHILEGGSRTPALPFVAVDAEGVPLAGYMRSLDPTVLAVFRCADAACVEAPSDFTVWSPPAGTWVGHIAVAAGQGNPTVMFASGDTLLFGTCVAPDCEPDDSTGSAFAELQTVPAGGVVNRPPQLALRADGSPVVLAYLDEGRPERIMLVSCESPACVAPQRTILAKTDDTWSESALSLGPDGRARVAWTHDGELWLAICSDAMCTSFDSQPIRGAADVAIAVGADGLPILAVSTPEAGLELVVCRDEACTPGE